MKCSTWSCLALASVLGCGASEDRLDAPFGLGGGSIGGGSSSGGSPAGGSASGGTLGGSPGGSLSGPGSCGSQHVNSGRITADVLIVLDRSLSMQMNGVDRWNPSVAGLKLITESLQDRVGFGLMAFPGPGARSGDFSSCDPGTLRVPIAPDNAAAIAASLDMTRPGGRTPTAVTLNAARSVVVPPGGFDPDARPTPKYVLLVTDGAPNCSEQGGGAVGGGGGVAGTGEPAAIEASVDEVMALTQAGVKTYVLGYDTQADPALKAALDRMAAAGGTGESAHRPIEDQASLVAAFREITAVAITCDFELENEVVDAKYVDVRLDGERIGLRTPNGWILGTDNRTITLQGDACSTIKEAGHSLAISIECEPIPELF